MHNHCKEVLVVCWKFSSKWVSFAARIEPAEMGEGLCSSLEFEVVLCDLPDFQLVGSELFAGFHRWLKSHLQED